MSRYAPATQLWRGRLHVMGGSKENRHTPGLEHWSIAVKDGKVLEKEWRNEIPIPHGGPHRLVTGVWTDILLILQFTLWNSDMKKLLFPVNYFHAGLVLLLMIG